MLYIEILKGKVWFVVFFLWVKRVKKYENQVFDWKIRLEGNFFLHGDVRENNRIYLEFFYIVCRKIIINLMFENYTFLQYGNFCKKSYVINV